MKVDFDITAGQMADELFNKFLILNPYQSNQYLRKRIAIQSAIEALKLIQNYSEKHLASDEFFYNVKQCLMVKLNA